MNSPRHFAIALSAISLLQTSVQGFQDSSVHDNEAPTVDYYQANPAGDCGGGSYHVFSVELPGLIGAYAGIAGLTRMTELHFGRHFQSVTRIWLHVAGATRPLDYPTGVEFIVSLNGAFSPGYLIPPSPLNVFDVCIPLTPADTILDGSAAIHLVIELLRCCDFSAGVRSAALVIEAIPKPIPSSLADFAAFQNCFSGAEAIFEPGCQVVDFDGDDRVDLIDFVEFMSMFVGP